MELMYTSSLPVLLKKPVSRTRIMSDQLRKEYVSLIHESLSIIATLDIRDQNGRIIESGSSVIDKILLIERKGNDISKEAAIIGDSKWLRLKELWTRMREIETQNEDLITQTKSTIIKES